jgi:hypothetical protein
MGLIEAVEGVVKRKIPILGCCKCSTWWITIAYCLFTTRSVIPSVAVSFLFAYLAVWLELSFGLIDNLYNRIYESVFTAETADAEGSEGEVSQLRQKEKQVEPKNAQTQ